MNRFMILFCLVFGLAIAGAASAQTPEAVEYKIDEVVYHVDGSTRIHPLSRAVDIDTKKVFSGRSALDAYIDDLRILFSNQRVLESVDIQTVFGPKNDNGVIPVALHVNVVDTWNIIGMPYPKYDSNTGFQFKLKLKNYNFFGSMQELNSDIVYELSDDGKSSLGTNVEFAIPFAFMDYDLEWTNDFFMEFPMNEVPEFKYTTGLSFERSLGSYLLQFALDHTTAINPRSDDELLKDDPLYFTEKFSVGLPIVLAKLDYFGDVSWTPSMAFTTNWSPDGVHFEDLKGPVYSLSHSLSAGRVDWVGNFRKGASASISNSWGWNFHYNDGVRPDIQLELKGYSSFMDRLGLTSRIAFYQAFYDTTNDKIAEQLRGIANDRIDTDSAIMLNIDMPVRVMRVNFHEITGVSWTKYISYEMHASPFFDMALTRDSETGRLYNPADGWYSGGMELIVYPMKMRSIYGRIMAGFDIPEVLNNGGDTGAKAERDDSAVRELFIGIGLHY